MSLERLLEQATPGPWNTGPNAVINAVYAGKKPVASVTTQRSRDNFTADRDLIALAPDMARLLIDMAAWVNEERCATPHCDPICEQCGTPEALLARFADLEQQAAR